MTHRERFEAVLAGQRPDRIPAVFRLDYWYRAHAAAGDLPAELNGMTLEQMEDFLGLGRSSREAVVFRTRLRPPAECVERREGGDLITEWRTPGRTLRKVWRYGPGDEQAGLRPTIVEHPIRSIDDYAAFEFIMRQTEHTADYDAYRRYDAAVGPAGLPMVRIGQTPFHHLLLEWTGYERGYVDLHERPDVVLQAVRAATETFRRLWPIVAESPAKLLLHGVNFDRAMTPPPVFREHFLPYLREFNQQMHQAGKVVACHADGNSTGLLDLIVEAGFDVAECFACEPMVPCTMEAAREAWRDRITIWGGVPSVLLEPHVPVQTLAEHMEHLFATLQKGDRFILGLADMALPSATWEHVKCAAAYTDRS